MELELRRLRGAGPDFAVAVEEIRIRTRRRVEFLDVTDAVARWVEGCGVVRGLLQVQSRHTTTGVVLNENEPGLIEDFERTLERWAPRGDAYRHDDLAARAEVPPGERPNADAHLRALLLGSSVGLGVAGGVLQLGRWQRLFLVELDGPRERRLALHALGTGESRSWSAPRPLARVR